DDDGSVALKNYKVDLPAVRTGITMFLLGGAHPFTVVEEHDFKNMLSLACPQYKHVGRHTIKRDVMDMFQKERKEVIDALTNSPGRRHLLAQAHKEQTLPQLEMKRGLILN
ncbi:hypothetical protein ACJX0J_035432, partial [Zea mays]